MPKMLLCQQFLLYLNEVYRPVLEASDPSAACLEQTEKGRDHLATAPAPECHSRNLRAS
jgi:hypothetical protein